MPNAPFIASKLPTVTRLSLGLATVIHLISYALPMGGFRGPLWGEMYWMRLLPRFLNVLDWTLGSASLVLLYGPLAILLYLIVRWFRRTDPTQKVPRLRWLVAGLILPNLVIPSISLYGVIVEKNSLVNQEMIAYLVWNASFWLFFYGFWCYAEQHRRIEKILSDHLID